MCYAADMASVILPTTSATTPVEGEGHREDDGDRDESQDQAVLDGGLALLVTAEALQHVLERDVELEH